MNAPVNSSSQSGGTHAATAPVGALAKEISKSHAPQSRAKRSSATVHAQIISALQRQERTRSELAQEVEATPEVVIRFLGELRDLGVVYVKRRVRFMQSQTNLTEVFALNRSPFENEDAPRPKGSRHNRKASQ